MKLSCFRPCGRSLLLLLFAFFGETNRCAEASVSWDPIVVCPGIVTEGGNEICRGSLEYYGPSLAGIPEPGMEVEYVGGWDWIYTFVSGLPEGTRVDGFNEEELNLYVVGEQVSIELDDDEVTCTVTVGQETCTSCEFCEFGSGMNSAEDATFSADCTNLQKVSGKAMKCASVLPVFLPYEFSDEALSDLPSSPSRPPSMAPITAQPATASTASLPQMKDVPPAKCGSVASQGRGGAAEQANKDDCKGRARTSSGGNNRQRNLKGSRK